MFLSRFRRALLGAWGTLLLACGGLWAWDIQALQWADYGVILGFVSAGLADVALAVSGRVPRTRRRSARWKRIIVALNLLALVEAVGIAAMALHFA